MRQVRRDISMTEWPEIKSALMDLVSNVIMHPESSMEWFVGWCQQHHGAVAAIASADFQ